VLSNKDETNRTGYEDEKWHWSYLPVSVYYLRFYGLLISYNDIQGFKGATLAKDLEVIELFVFGVNECN